MSKAENGVFEIWQHANVFKFDAYWTTYYIYHWSL